MKYFLLIIFCFILIGCFLEENNKIFNKRIEKIIKTKNVQEAIIDIDNLLSPIFYKNPEKLSFSEKNIVYIMELEREVNNGGFYQYFFNSSGSYTIETIEALKIIGSKTFFDLLIKAKNIFPNEIVPKNNNERQKLIFELTEKDKEIWNDLDSEFYKYEEDIYKLLLDYINENINYFR